MKQLIKTSLLLWLLTLIACSTDDNPFQTVVEDDNNSALNNYKLLSLGDSYTVGQGVCNSCKFPVQLKDELESRIIDSKINIEIIAQTGWTTNNLLNNVTSQSLPSNFDLVTLLIGVNNQYQNRPFTLYEEEFPLLVQSAIEKGQGDPSNVIVISIPDYAFTPFGQNNPEISEEINQYNAFAQNYCNSNSITFVNITDITRLGLEQPELVASDGLHPSELAYSKFVERILPFAIQKIQ
jgi:lysophospholipase L1-like esterase